MVIPLPLPSPGAASAAFGGTSSSLKAPHWHRSTPAQAIIAPLSVQSFAGGMAISKPSSPRIVRAMLPDQSPGWQRHHRQRPGVRRPVVSREKRRIAERVRSLNTSTAAASKPAARSALRLRIERRRADDLAHGRLQAGEREVGTFPAQHRAGKSIVLGVAGASEGFNGRTAGIGQPEKLCRLVEGFAHRVVDGRAVEPVSPQSFDGQKLAMAARYQEQQI